MDYRLLLFDLDATLLNEAREIDHRNAKVLRSVMAQGVRVSFATGRSPRSGATYVAMLAPNAPVIHFNGALVYDHRARQIVQSQALPRQHALAALTVCRDMGLHVNLYVGDEIRIALRTPTSSTSEVKDGVPHTVVGNLVEHLAGIDDDPIKLLCIGDPELFEPFAARVRAVTADGVSIVNSEPDYFEVLPKGVNKAMGAAALAKHLDLDLSEVAAFGDNKNDIELLEACGLGVAMANSDPALLPHADVVIGDHRGDAIAQFIRSMR